MYIFRLFFVAIFLSSLLGIQFGSTASIRQATSYEYRTFSSCQDLESTLKKVMPINHNDGRLFKGGIMYDTMAVSAVPAATKMSNSTPHSETNIQVRGVDEADTVKTDGKYIYSYQEGERAIIVLDAKTLTRLKTLQIPVNYSGVSFYITKNTLILTATRYTTLQNSWANWYNNTQKSIVTIYDIRDITRASVIRSIEVDGSLSDTRLGDTGMLTAVVTTSYWMPPIYRPYFSDIKMIQRPSFDYTARNLIPQISDQQFRNNRKTITNKAMSDCTSMSSVLPKISGSNTSPTLTSILRFDTSVPDSRIATQIIVSDAGQIHVTPDSIYLTTNVWTQGASSKCPTNARCMSPLIWNPGTSNTLIHRFSVDNANIRYNYSRQIPGTPLNQYSMDEDGAKNFRIITTNSSWSGGTNTSTTGVSVLSPNGTIIGSLSGLAPGENFQSSRFIGDRLYLVTFEQIDPLFVISIADPKNPKVLGELKIPGYSTYLHPYDANRLIGIGYDTQINQWGGTQNTGVKIDLYNVSDVKNPKQERSLVLGDAGSSSDALSNPKAFVWYKEKNMLLMPATLMMSAGDKENPYLSKSAFQGVIGVSITPDQIVEKFRITHIAPPVGLEANWKKECAPYTDSASYVPSYCEKNGTLDMYLANTIWNYSSDFVSRVLYVGESLYTIGSSRIQMQSFSTPQTPTAMQKFKIQNYGRPMPVDIMPAMMR